MTAADDRLLTLTEVTVRYRGAGTGVQNVMVELVFLLNNA